MNRAAVLAAAAAAALASAGATAQAVRWVSLYADRDGETFYDPGSLKRSGNRARITLRMTAPSDVPWSAVARLEVDCKAQSSALIEMKRYGAGPEPVQIRTVPKDKIVHEPMFAAEDMEPVYRVACPKGAPLRQMTGPKITVVPPPRPPGSPQP